MEASIDFHQKNNSAGGRPGKVSAAQPRCWGEGHRGARGVLGIPHFDYIWRGMPPHLYYKCIYVVSPGDNHFPHLTEVIPFYDHL